MKLSKRNCVALTVGVLATLASFAPVAQAATLAEMSLDHYKLANLLAKTGKHAQAIDEYKAAYRLNPESQVGRYSYQALAGYGLTREQLAQAKAAAAIADQAAELNRQTANHAEENVKATVRGTKMRIRNIEANKNARIRHVVNNPSVQHTVVGYPGYFGIDPFGRRLYYPGAAGVVTTVDPVRTQARIDLAKAEAKAQKERVEEYRKEKSQEIRDRAAEKARLVNESARNLQSQMRGRGVKLDPTRSNLFIRTYR